MKNLKLIGFLMLILSSFMFIQCTSDPIAGADGTNGIDGVNGVDGADGIGVQECVACHSDSHRESIDASYLLSVHAKETLHTDSSTGMVLTTSEYTNRTGCVQCHTSGGFIDLLTNQPLKTGGGVAKDDPAYPVDMSLLGESSSHTQAVNCKTCHVSHSSFDFANDGNDMALRQGFMPVTLDQDPTYTIDMGLSNTCVVCHQPRGLPPTTATVKLSSRFGPHHGPQSTFLEGIQGALYVGSTVYPAPQSAAHRKGSSCTACHMGESEDETEGLHSWHPAEDSCLNCHKNGAPSEVSGYAADMLALEALLVEKGAFDPDKDAFTSNTVPLNVAQAAWNFALLREDRSNGIHNPGYAKALLKNSLEAAAK